MAEIETSEKRQIWRSFASAVGAELREATSVQGVSGLDHPVQALAVDEERRRVIVVSAEPSARMAALMQLDVQSKMPNSRVIVARPVSLDVGALARQLFGGSEPRIPIAMLNQFSERLQALPEDARKAEMNAFLSKVGDPVVRSWKNASLPAINQLMDIANQLVYVDWEQVLAGIRAGTTATEIDLSSVCNIDMTVVDRRCGVCPLPLFEFGEKDWELLLSGGQTEALQARLRDLDILQYFFPAPDQVALGLIDQGVRSAGNVVGAISQAVELGHPLARPELVPNLTKFSETVDCLKQSGHVVDGEYGLEVTSAGATIRANVRIRPKEGLISKLLARMNINLSASPKDFLGP